MQNDIRDSVTSLAQSHTTIMAGKSVSFLPSSTPFSYAVLGLSAFLGIPYSFDLEQTDGLVLTVDGVSTSNAADALHQLADNVGRAGDSETSTRFHEIATSLPTKTAFAELSPIIDTIDDHLAYRTFIIGHALTAADWAVWGALRASIQAVGVLKRGAHPHVQRWMSYIESLTSTQQALAALTEVKSKKGQGSKAAASFSLGLPDAVKGQVITRFPPEPSGYLHIGHAKAAILNQYFARMYEGKLIVRFDDTNPSKERSEFQETILEDLKLLGIEPDILTHTSDYFDKLYEYGVQMIKSGKAYADDTGVEQMREERTNGIASKHRDDPVEENLKRFEEMKSGSTEGARWCIRAKISVDDPNKALRDPVIYRCNATPHHITGVESDKWKIYPTYDFACPIVDSIEGVTHALRTNEYRDRNPQYAWMIEALGLRKVIVWDFSRINFIYTLLSKRKLHWFVDEKLVSGWDDPRFPTVRGIRRRGMTVEALRQFMLAQGPSQAQLMLEWDTFWALNKKVIDPVAPRHWAIAKEGMVTATINSAVEEVKEVPLHKKNPDVGNKKTVYSKNVIMEKEDADSFEDKEEITLMDWGNAILKSKSDGALEFDLHLEGDFKKTKKKVTWLALPTPNQALVHATLLDYDYLITKKKLDEGDNVEDFVTPVTEFRTECWADANVLNLKKGDIMQFERKGYYIVDGVYDDPESQVSGAKRMEFVKIPDGRAAGLASKAGPEAVDASAKPKKDKASGGNFGKPVRGQGGTSSGTASSAPKLTQGASKGHPEGTKVYLSEGKTGYEIPITTKMYSVDKVGGEVSVSPEADTKMYAVKSVYDVS
ncbi:tRNA synthetases class I (E and Q) [Rhizoctonia solani]|uniref:glutamate--tRNA ligase n=1 Tax=Rhizoctonia solani TaxID=456999 RepID=A0A8H7M836_9AGAM|nr:tRNA synthetases class I (E and Q) [Rhizoctonia solani]